MSGTWFGFKLLALGRELQALARPTVTVSLAA